MPRFKGVKSNATGFTKMIAVNCKRKNNKTIASCKRWISTKNIAKYTAKGYKKDPDQTPRKSKAGAAAPAEAEEQG